MFVDSCKLWFYIRCYPHDYANICIVGNIQKHGTCCRNIVGWQKKKKKISMFFLQALYQKTHKVSNLNLFVCQYT